MRKFLPLLIILLLSCSKPAQEGSTIDSTAIESPVAEPGSRELVLATLTVQEADRVAVEIFLWLRKRLGRPNGLAYKEDFTINGNEFKYTVIVHHREGAGLQSSTSGGTRAPTEEETAAWEADSSNTEALQYVPYSEVNEWYVPEYDTLYASGQYTTYLESEPEATPKSITCQLEGTETRKNGGAVVNGVPDFSPRTSAIGQDEDGYTEDSFPVDFSTPLEFSRDELYVKAKIKDLTDEDLAGLTKDELGFVRNDIFARHGHTFKTAKMIDHYKNAEWYYSIVNDAAALLNKFEKRNVEFIKKKEG